MPIQDTPLTNEVVINDTPLETTPHIPASTKALDTFNAMKAAYLDNYNTGRPVVDGYQEYNNSLNKEAALTALSAEKVRKDNTAINQAFTEKVLQDPEVFSLVAPDIVQIQQENIESVQDSTRQFVDAMSTPETTPEVKAAVANYVKLWEMFEKATANVGTLEYGLDFIKSIVPFRDTINEAIAFGSVLGNEQTMEQLVLEFKSLSYEEQQALFPTVATQLLDYFGPIKGGEAVKKFIEPVTEGELSDFSNWWKLVDVVDMAGVGATTVALAARARKAFNIPKVLNAVGNKEKAGEASAAAMLSDEAAEALQLEKNTAVANALAFDTSIEDIGRTPGISTETLKSIESFFNEADMSVDNIIAGRGYLKEGILNTVERDELEAAAYSKLSKANHEDIVVINRTENTTTFSYKAKDENGEYFDDTFKLDLTLNDVGQWTQDQISVLSEFLASPTVFAKGLTRLDVNTAQRMDAQTAKVFRELSSLHTESVSSLGNLLRPKNKRRLEGVEKALREGDEYKWTEGPKKGTRGRVFTVEELVGQYGFDEGQVEAYYKTNRLYNNLWRLRNNAKREEMIAFQFKQVDLLDGEYSFGKSFDTSADARSALSSNNVGNVFDAVEDVVHTDLSGDFLEAQYMAGKKLVRLEHPYLIGGGRGKFTHILVDMESVKELPATVLNRKAAYVPKIAKDGFWFVKEFGDEVIDGKTVSGRVLKTHRYFDNKAEADAYTEQLRLKDMADNKLTRLQAEDKYKALEDRELEIVATATGKFSNGSGGLYTGVRAEDDILFGLNGEASQRISPYEALSRNIANISRLVPINQWRLGLEQRWLNTANKLLGVKIERFGPLPDSVQSTRKGEFLNKMAAQIRDWQGFPSREEQIYNAVNQRMYEWALKKDMGTAASIIGWARGKDPISATRAAAFHSLLGWFNPAQLWVQAQGMSIAVSLNLGKNLTKTLRHTTGLTMIGQGYDKASGVYKLAAKAAGMEPDELAEMHRLWQKTGFEDSILQTADHAASISGHGIAMDAISRAADKGLMFYRHGELLNRRMAFTTALDEWRTANAGVKVSDEALKSIMDRANNLMLNITKANRAQWQKGIASVPTQFFQVSAKALETVAGFNDNLTSAERMRVLAGQIALYGAAGVPLAGLGANYAMEVLGVSQEELDSNPLLVKTLNDGFWGFTTLGIFGVDAEVSKRGSLIRGVTDFVDNWMFSESTVGVKLMGAFGATGQRFWDSFTKQMRPITMGAVPLEALDIAKIPTLSFLESISSWRNVEKAVLMQAVDAIFDKRGDKNVERNFELRESIMAAIGFQLSDEVKPYTLSERTQHVLDTNKKIADIIIQRMNQVSLRSEMGTLSEEYIKETEQMYAFLYASVPYDRQKDIMNNVRNRLTQPDKVTRAIKRYIDKVYGDRVAGLSELKAAVLGEPVLTITTDETK